MRSEMASAEAMVFDVDLRGPQAAEAIVSGTLERFARIDAWLNIAGAVAQRRGLRCVWTGPFLSGGLAIASA